MLKGGRHGDEKDYCCDGAALCSPSPNLPKVTWVRFLGLAPNPKAVLGPDRRTGGSAAGKQSNEVALWTRRHPKTRQEAIMFRNPMDGPCLGFDYDEAEMDWLDMDDDAYHQRVDEESCQHDAE